MLGLSVFILIAALIVYRNKINPFVLITILGIIFLYDVKESYVVRHNVKDISTFLL